MPLDIDALFRRVEEMVIQACDSLPEARLADVQDLLRRVDPQDLRNRLRQREGPRARIPWLVAEPVDTLASVFPPPVPPADMSVVAADGSSIPPDRHSPMRYYVLNIGYAVLTYGREPDAVLKADERFCFEEQDLYHDPLGKRIPIEGTRLGIHMSVKEMGGLSEATCHAARPVVALRDGSLILWNLQSEDQDLQTRYLDEFLEALNKLHQNDIPLASYISYPGSNDVVNSLRLVLCDNESGGCARCPQQTEAQVLCRFAGGIRDRQVFGGLLGPGERSDVFQSQSAILSHYGAHRIQFFYLNVGGEIARIESPQWVMNDPEMLQLVHGVVVDQCRRSGHYPPYPPALIEAHEQAVISTADRQTVEEMVERALAQAGVFYVRSAKDRSKRSRGV